MTSGNPRRPDPKHTPAAYAPDGAWPASPPESAGPHAHTPAEVRAVQLWARDAVERWYRTPRDVRAPDGTWQPNPERARAAREAAHAVPTVAVVLGVPWQDIGPCARCRAYCHRYGDGGRPLCGSCRHRGRLGGAT